MKRKSFKAPTDYNYFTSEATKYSSEQLLKDFVGSLINSEDIPKDCVTELRK